MTPGEKTSCHSWVGFASVLKQVYVQNHSYENEVGLEIHFQVNQSHFHMRDFVQGLILKQRLKLIQKWPMKLMSQISDSSWIFKLSKLQNINGHVLRKERNDDCMVAMEWQPEGKTKVGWPKTTWRRMVEKESRQEKWTSWAEVRGAAQDRASWQEKVTALCASWRGEN